MKSTLDNIAFPDLAFDAAHGAILSRFFSYSVLTELIKFGHSKIAGRISSHHRLLDNFPSGTTVAQFYDELFDRLTSTYRHEYIYKNALAEKVLLGKHNLKTAYMLTEFPVGKCKADVAIFNGTSHVYEIKSDMDNFDRLDSQISAYKQLFEYITVITSERLYDSVAKKVDETVGIMVLAKDSYRFKKSPYREPLSNLGNIQNSTIFDSLRKSEYLNIIKNLAGVSLDHIPNTQVYKLARSYFEVLDPIQVHKEMVEQIKSRQETYKVAEYIDNIPNSLKAAYLSLKLSKADNSRLIEALNSDITIAFK